MFIIAAEQPEYYENFNLTSVKTPVNVPQFKKLLQMSNYDEKKSQYLTDGFENGFSIGYEGDKNVNFTAPNLKLTIGSETELWNKVMKEVKLGRYAGPYEKVPFDHFIQSPIGLVPKDGGKKTRLIFHLSYPRKVGKNEKPKSVNANTPTHKTTVVYSSFDDAIKLCLKCGKHCKMGKSDMSSAFRHLGIKPDHWKYLVMKAKSPFDGKFYYFVDKCLPFGASISCAHFQAFSDAVAHIVKYLTKQDLLNYLDDYFFVDIVQQLCNQQISKFLEVCDLIRFPVALEKTFWATTRITFLGLLIDSDLQMVFIPLEKIQKAQDIVWDILLRKSNKVTLRELQKVCGLLNFFCKCIVPGRAFTRRLYAFTASKKQKLLPGHHIYLNAEMRADLEMWLLFFKHPSIVARPFIEFSRPLYAGEINMFTDSAGNKNLGTGGYCDKSWFTQNWESSFITDNNPSIEYLELFGVAIAVVNWIHRFSNKRIILFCDNQSVVHMINNTTSSCKNCMYLIRIIVLHGLINNVRIYAKHVRGASNEIADSLSRGKLTRFFELTANLNFDKNPTSVPSILWPMSKIWMK